MVELTKIYIDFCCLLQIKFSNYGLQNFTLIYGHLQLKCGNDG